MQMPANPKEKRAVSSQLALMYLEYQDISGLSLAEFAQKFFDVRDEIQAVVDQYPHL